MLRSIVALAAGALLACGLQAASAQEFNEIQAVIKPQLALERARELRRIMRNRSAELLHRRMDPDGQDIAPLFYGEGGQVPAEDTSPEPIGVNLWLEASGGRLEDNAPLRAYDGTQFIVTAGADRSFGERLILGVLGVHSGNDIDNVFVPGSSSTRGLGAGGYGAVFLTDTVIMTGSVLHIWTDNEAGSGVVTAAYDSREWTGNLAVTSYHFSGDWQFAPSVGISYSQERDDAYTDSFATFNAASTTRTGSVSFGAKAAYTHVMDNGVSVEPSLEAEGEWIFERSTTATSSMAPDTSDFDASVTAGIDLAISEAVSLSFSGTVSGLARSDYISTTGGGRLSVSF
ncbi:autotransporter outer membrane beta-barrel domain-containing protein [Oricola sp.]|uniref:autotransporter outer membrane beta-barrel domain-containing protein n=1 Tax=Oricola sp. TaxID=1979950 RepID=UPI003BAA391D